MASLSLFVIERHSKVWLLRLLIHRSHQSKLPILRGMELEKGRWSQFLKALSFDLKLLKVLPNCPVRASFSLFQNECPLKVLVVVVRKIQTHPLLFGYTVLHLIHFTRRERKRTEQNLYMKNTCQKKT